MNCYGCNKRTKVLNKKIKNMLDKDDEKLYYLFCNKCEEKEYYYNGDEKDIYINNNNTFITDKVKIYYYFYNIYIEELDSSFKGKGDIKYNYFNIQKHFGHINYEIRKFNLLGKGLYNKYMTYRNIINKYSNFKKKFINMPAWYKNIVVNYNLMYLYTIRKKLIVRTGEYYIFKEDNNHQIKLIDYSLRNNDRLGCWSDKLESGVYNKYNFSVNYYQVYNNNIYIEDLIKEINHPRRVLYRIKTYGYEYYD